MFEDDLGSSSKVYDLGGTHIVIDKLETIVNESIFFIKIDIEGWEIPALEGCKSHFKYDHPKIAIAVYHKAEDFLKVPELVL
jgi:FkbM family methyltransferase